MRSRHEKPCSSRPRRRGSFAVLRLSVRWLRVTIAPSSPRPSTWQILPCGNGCSALELLQIIIGAGHIREMITVKQAGPVAAGDLLEVGQHGSGDRSTMELVLRHGSQQGPQVTFDTISL